MKGARALFLVSWIIVAIVSVGIILVSLGSLSVAFSSAQEILTPEYTTVQLKEQGGEQAVKAFKGRRVTAATSSLAFGLLAFLVAIVPYRRAERWAWWAILLSVGLSQLLSMARVVAIGTTVGAGTGAVLLAFTLLGLLAGTPRIFARPTPVETL